MFLELGFCLKNKPKGILMFIYNKKKNSSIIFFVVKEPDVFAYFLCVQTFA